MVMLTLGTGVGGGIVIDGRIYRGTRGEPQGRGSHFDGDLARLRGAEDRGEARHAMARE